MKDFEKVISEIRSQLNDVNDYDGDIGDVGNELGRIVGKYIDNDRMGWDKEDLIAGFKHGISLVDGTH